MTEPLLTAAEVAALLSVRESWVREATRDGRLPHLRLGRYRRYRQADIERWLETQAEPGRLAIRTRTSQ
jgi:excisionase family DNA binding protein